MGKKEILWMVMGGIFLKNLLGYHIKISYESILQAASVFLDKNPV